MPEPELHLGDLRLVLEGIGGRRSLQGMDAQARHRVEQSHLAGILLHDVPVDGYRVQGFGQGFARVILDGPKQRLFQLRTILRTINGIIKRKCVRLNSWNLL
jgi:hypothetical protein